VTFGVTGTNGKTSIATMIHLIQRIVNETVSGVVFAPFVFVSLIWKPLVPKYALFFCNFL
jgi:hypothetical protein